MFKRVMVGVIGIPLLLLVLSFAPAWATMLLLMALCAVGARELLHAVGAAGDRPLLCLTVLMAGLLPAAVYGEGFHGVMHLTAEGETRSWLALSVLALLFVLGLFLHAILRYGKEGAVPFAHLTAGIFGGLLFPLMFSCLLRLRMGELGQVMVWLPLAISFGSDTFALFAGMAFGRHKLAPHVSPKKTVEGGVGGLLGGVLGMMLLHAVGSWILGSNFLSWGQILALGLLGSVIDQIGDLSFSVIKREFGVKDYGKLLPGHGGVLDRFDSVTFVAPFAYLLSALLG